MAGVIDNPLADDLDHVLHYTASHFEELRGGSIFITGGTGFFGCWLLESLLWANRKLNLKASALVLTRDTQAFRRKAPHLASDPLIQLHPGDVRSFPFPKRQFSHVIHGATQSSARMNEDDPALMLDTIVRGTERVLQFAAHSGCRSLLLTSSGAVYGAQPADVTHVSEEFNGGPDPLRSSSAYAEGKRLAELLCAIGAPKAGVEAKIARCYAFVGPYLPLDGSFAVGNFIRDGLFGGPIKIQGDGTPHRSYLYAADLMIWLWTILFQGQPLRAYNVGSEKSHSILEIAQVVRDEMSPRPAIEIAQAADQNEKASRYVPSTRRAQEELGLGERVSLAQGIAKTIAWQRAARSKR